MNFKILKESIVNEMADEDGFNTEASPSPSYKEGWDLIANIFAEDFIQAGLADEGYNTPEEFRDEELDEALKDYITLYIKTRGREVNDSFEESELVTNLMLGPAHCEPEAVFDFLKRWMADNYDTITKEVSGTPEIASLMHNEIASGQ